MRATTGLLAASHVFVTASSYAAEDTLADIATVPTGDWRVVVDTPIGELPFNMELVRSGDDWTAIFKWSGTYGSLSHQRSRYISLH